MLLNNIVLPLLTVAASAPSVSAAHLPFSGSKRGHVGLDRMKRDDGHGDLDRRTGTYDATPRNNIKRSRNGKRLVRRQSMQTCNSTTPTSTTTNGAGSASSTSSSAAASSTAPSSPWNLVDTWSGNSFFDNWNFWHWDDPTHGDVEYVDVGQAWDEGLISINDQGHAIMKMETTNWLNRPRKSVRIHGNLVFTGGLVLMDARHMPYGCGTWPAWWQNGPNWPSGGEIDIVEGVNAFTQNQVSLHTDPGCYMPQSMNYNQVGDILTGNYDAYDCSSAHTSNQGCGVRDSTTSNTYGQTFNQIGGGVYALQWAKDGIKVWFHPRYNIPMDIVNDAPVPDNWGTPMANFPSDSCNPYQFFYDNFNIFDTTLCGDWAGADGVWNYAGYAGQDQSCAAITGYDNCVDYVRAQGSAFEDAFWQIQYVKYFNSTELV